MNYFFGGWRCPSPIGNGQQLKYFIVASTLKVSIVYALLGGGILKAIIRCRILDSPRFHWLKNDLFTGNESC